MSEPIRQARDFSNVPFVPKMPECLRDTAQKPSEQKAEQKTVTALDVLAVIREKEPINRAGIAAILGVAGAALNTHIKNLREAEEIVQEDDGNYYALTHLPDQIWPAEPEVIHGATANTRSLDEPTEHLFDAELTAALELITARLNQPAGIKPLSKDDHRVFAFSRLIPMLSDDLAEAVSEILGYVTGESK